MRSHFSIPRGVATACAVAGASAILNGNCSAQNPIAADFASDPAYASGWSAGQNGGYGFGPWSMNGTETTSPIEAALDRTSSQDPFGVAWTLYNPEGSAPQPPPGTGCINSPIGTDISRAGRAMPNGGLRPGDTLSTVIANPECRKFYRGYTIVLSNGSDNIQYGGAGSMLSVGTFEYFSYGRWYAAGTNGFNHGYTGTTLFDSDTCTNGMQLDVTLTSTNSYHLVMTPLDNPGIAYTDDGGFVTNGPVSWITFQLYNTDSNFYPSLAPCGPDRTDFYIKSMTVTGMTLNIQRIGSDVLLSWSTLVPGFHLESALNLGPAAAWNPVSPLPTVVNGRNVVTNSVLSAQQQFYRLHYLP